MSIQNTDPTPPSAVTSEATLGKVDVGADGTFVFEFTLKERFEGDAPGTSVTVGKNVYTSIDARSSDGRQVMVGFGVCR